MKWKLVEVKAKCLESAFDIFKMSEQDFDTFANIMILLCLEIHLLNSTTG